MTEPAPPGAVASTGAPVPERAMVRSPLSDGEWHRLHPLTPLLRGGLVLLVVIGIVVANLRDRLLEVFLPVGGWSSPEGETIDFIFANNLVPLVLVGLVGLLVVIVLVLFVSWRFHTFRITGDDVEVRTGVLFRTHRRAPLDRVQGVNLTRPMIARLLGAAKLEVVGAGTDANVKLEYLSTANAEAVRGDILRLASGRQLGERSLGQQAPAGSVAHTAVSTVSEGLTGLIEGVDRDDAPAESVVNIPVGRLIASQALSPGTVFLALLTVFGVIGAFAGPEWMLIGVVPTVFALLIGFGAYGIRQITRSLRYSIAPTTAGVRITFGLFTTVTETIPPGRIHAVEIRQSILWRPFGWWTIRVNRLSGQSVSDSSTRQQFAEVLPVGTRADVERVLRLVLPSLPENDWPAVFEHGILGPVDDDPYVNTPRRAAIWRPFSWRRNGALVAPAALLLRTGAIWRMLVIVPLARLQSVRAAQGPIDRALRTATLTGHTVTGPVTATVAHLDRDDALSVWEAATAGAVRAAASDTSHRWNAAAAAGPVPAGPLIAVGPDAAGSATVGSGAVTLPDVPQVAAAPTVAAPDVAPPAAVTHTAVGPAAVPLPEVPLIVAAPDKVSPATVDPSAAGPDATGPDAAAPDAVGPAAPEPPLTRRQAGESAARMPDAGDETSS
ncbi:PH domain-containing protein [Microbacterium sp.]|uniref:PH domain-containing protein n=1 Tax=Microbacterium sp. TaxID=51671 RepID=UPI003A8B24B5